MNIGDGLKATGEFGTEVGKRIVRPLARGFINEITEGFCTPRMVSNTVSTQKPFQRKTDECGLKGILRQTREGVLYSLPQEPEPGLHSMGVSVFTPDSHFLGVNRALRYPTLLEINRMIRKDLDSVSEKSLIRNAATGKIIGYFDGETPVFLSDKYNSLLSIKREKIAAELKSKSGLLRPYYVIGNDDRIPVDPSSSIPMYPWSTMCFIQAQFPDNSWWAGSGSLVGKRHVLTAGHVISMKKLGGWAKTVRVYPAINGWAHQPYGSYESSSPVLHSVDSWTKDERPEWDFGMIILNKDVQAKDGSTPGTLGIAVATDENLKSQAVNLTGYPGEKAAATLWTSSGMVTGESNESFDYEIDETSGDSGGPVWRYWSTEGGKVSPVVVGINAYEHWETTRHWYTLWLTSDTRFWNSATRISKQKADFIKDWLKF